MKLSIIIPSYCSEKNIENCLKSIVSQEYQNFEVLIVDCSPHNEVESIVNSFNSERIKFISVDKRFNPGEGRNIGVENSSGEYLVFIDSDVVLDVNALKHISEHATTGYKIFGAALELNKVVNDSFSANIEHLYFNHESQSSRSITKRNNLSSAFMIVERKLFIEFNGFSEIPRMQDTELTERISYSGIKLYFFPDVIGYQIQDSPINKVLKKIRITGNNLYFIRYKDTFWFMRYVLFFMLPIMMVAKISRINLRNAKYSFSIPMLFFYCPLMYFCGFFWMLGFYRAIIINDGIATGR